MRRIISVMCVLIFISVNVDAQTQRGQIDPEDRAKRQTEQMKTDLDLNDEQVEAVKSINEKYSKKMSEAFEQAGDQREQMRVSMKQLRSNKDEELKELLTTEQFEKHKKIEDQRMKKMRQREGNSENRKEGSPRGQRGNQRDKAE